MTIESLPTRKYNVHMVFDIPYWAYYNDCCSLGVRAPSDFLVTASNDFRDVARLKSDLCLLCYYQQTKLFTKFIKENNLKTKLVTQYTVGWGHKNNIGLQNILPYNKEHVVINNYTTWSRLGKIKGTSYIPNGVERGFFKVFTPIEKRPLKLVYVGSQNSDHVKNYSSILLPLQARLRSKGIECDFRCVDNRNPANYMSRKQLAAWYNTASIYVVASSCEGTPNPALEAASCGCTVVSTRVGNMPELIKDGYNGYLCDCNIDSLYDGCMKALSNTRYLQHNMQTEIEKWDWKYSADEYYNYFRHVIDAG